MIDTTDLAYAAGYIDGDGCFHLGKRSRKFISSIIVSSTDKEIIQWFRNLFGGYISTKRNVPIGQKIQYHFGLKKVGSIFLIKQVLPYLVEKQDEARIFMEFCHTASGKEALIDKIKNLKLHCNLVFPEQKLSFESAGNTIVPSIQDFAYLAGFIDSECCFSICRYKTKNNVNYLYKIMLQCNNTKAPVFKWLLERFGGNIHFIDRSRMPRHRNQLSWRICSKSLGVILDKILPFLKHKKSVCEELIKFYKKTLPNGGARHTNAFRDSYRKVLVERESIFHKVQFLNKKGA